MPRPRTTTDDQILAAVTRAISRVGPQKLTLADVGAEAGVSAATLVQRFGTKRALLLALCAHSTAGVPEAAVALRTEGRGPLETLRRMFVSSAEHTPGAVEFVNHLAFFQMNLADPEFHRLEQDFFKAELRVVRALLRDAVAAGELSRDVDVGRLATTVQTAVNGARIVWAVRRGGTLPRFLHARLDDVLDPWRA